MGSLDHGFTSSQASSVRCSKRWSVGWDSGRGEELEEEEKGEKKKKGLHFLESFGSPILFTMLWLVA